MERIRTPFLVASAIAMFITILAHIFLGGPEINEVVQASHLVPEVRVTTAVVWHMTTALLIYLYISTLALIKHANFALAIGVICLEAVFAALFLGFSVTHFSSAIALPQWTAFAVCAVLTLPALDGAGR